MRRVTVVAGGMASMAVIVLVSVCVAGLGETSANVEVLDLMGSVFARGSALGYVVVGLLGMVLGVTLTLLGVRWEGPSQRVNTGESLSSWQTDDKDTS